MLIKMLQTRKGSEDGFTVKQYYKNEIYNVRESLGRSFLAAEFATLCDLVGESYDY
jgi:hypothetical protein